MNKQSETILVVDDDKTFTKVLAKALTDRGFNTLVAHAADETREIIATSDIDRIILDLNIGNDSGLSMLPDLVKECADSKIVILTGYSSIATAVEAIKLGATNYLCKPADTDEILAAFSDVEGNPDIGTPDQPPSIDRIQWEHIQKVLREHDGNISATARTLGMHRRTLQRKLKKRPVQR